MTNWQRINFTSYMSMYICIYGICCICTLVYYRFRCIKAQKTRHIIIETNDCLYYIIIQIYEITLPVCPFCFSPGGNLCQFQQKPSDNIYKPSCKYQIRLHGRPSYFPQSAFASGMLISSIRTVSHNLEAPHHWPLSTEATGHVWIPLTKGQ